MEKEFTPIIDERDENERKEKIKQLQKYLREIALRDDRIPLLVIDGFFLDETQNAVRVFQEIYGLETDGEVDEQTWNRIYQEYVNIVGVEKSCLCFNIFENADSTLNQGDSGYSIYFVQVMLRRISDRFINFPKIEINGVVDENTLLAISEIRKIHNLDETASDKDIFDAVLTVYCSVSKI